MMNILLENSRKPTLSPTLRAINGLSYIVLSAVRGFSMVFLTMMPVIYGVEWLMPNASLLERAPYSLGLIALIVSLAVFSSLRTKTQDKTIGFSVTKLFWLFVFFGLNAVMLYGIAADWFSVTLPYFAQVVLFIVWLTAAYYGSKFIVLGWKGQGEQEAGESL